MTKLICPFRNYTNVPAKGDRLSSARLLDTSCQCAACRVGHRVLRRAGQPSADGGASARVEPGALRATLHTANHGHRSVCGRLRRGQGFLPGL